MRKRAIKNVLFSISLASLPAHAIAGGFSPGFAPTWNRNDLHLMEELPIETRVVVHQQFLQFAYANPEVAMAVRVIAADNEGRIYALDENMVALARIGEPSCIPNMQ